MATKRDNNHAAITLRSASTDTKTPYNYAHMNNNTLQNTKGAPIRHWNDRSRNRRTYEIPFIASCSHFSRKNTEVSCSGLLPKTNPMQQWRSHYNAFCSIRSLTRMFRHTWHQNVTAIMHFTQTSTRVRSLMWRPMRPFMNVSLFDVKSHPAFLNILLWCKVSHRPSWMYGYSVYNLTPPFMNVLLCDLKSHSALGECIVVWCKVSRRPSWMFGYVEKSLTAPFMNVFWCEVSHRPSWMYCYVM